MEKEKIQNLISQMTLEEKAGCAPEQTSGI